MTEREPTRVAVPADAVVRASVAPMLAEPQVTSGQISQQLAGHTVQLLEDQGDWVLACGTDDYAGWMHRGYLTRAAHGENARAALVSLGCVVAEANGTSRAFPLRALLPREALIQQGAVIETTKLASRFPTEARAITASAREFFVGTSYQWGGVTPWGADCSGLVQSVFALHGVKLPRDAWQQARTGRDAGRDMLALDEGDLLFFSDRDDAHVTHVGISLGERRMVHLALGRGGYAVERLDDDGDAYVRKLKERFLFARRVL